MQVRLAVLVFGAALAAAGCATPVRGPEPGPSPAVLSSSGLGRDFFVRQAVVARFGEEEQRFEIALQSRCGELRVVGLTRFGIRLFSAVRGAQGLEVETLHGQALPFAPERVLRDVERTFFRSDPPRSGDEQVVVFAGETVHEEWRDGQLVTRRVAIGDDDDPPLEIRYEGARQPPGISERVELRNPLVGYALSIHNHQVEELACDPHD